MGSVPERTCVGCRRRAAKGELIRLVAPDGVRLDTTATEPGRGAYLHPAASCLDGALASGSIARALRTAVSEAEAARLRTDMERIVQV